MNRGGDGKLEWNGGGGVQEGCKPNYEDYLKK